MAAVPLALLALWLLPAGLQKAQWAAVFALGATLQVFSTKPFYVQFLFNSRYLEL